MGGLGGVLEGRKGMGKTTKLQFLNDNENAV